MAMSKIIMTKILKKLQVTQFETLYKQTDSLYFKERQ